MTERYARQLGQQEDRMDAVRKEIDGLNEKLVTLNKELNDLLESITVEGEY